MTFGASLYVFENDCVYSNNLSFTFTQIPTHLSFIVFSLCFKMIYLMNLSYHLHTRYFLLQRIFLFCVCALLVFVKENDCVYDREKGKKDKLLKQNYWIFNVVFLCFLHLSLSRHDFLLLCLHTHTHTQNHRPISVSFLYVCTNPFNLSLLVLTDLFSNSSMHRHRLLYETICKCMCNYIRIKMKILTMIILLFHVTESKRR